MMGFGFGFGLFEIMFFIMFGLFFLVFVGTLLKGLGEWNKNNHSPRLTVPVTVVAKRTHVRGDHAHTTYYATFQFESGDRMELMVPGSESGLMVEGDFGDLTFQGTRFVSFDRKMAE